MADHDADDGEVPGSRLGRAARLARLGASTAAGLARGRSPAEIAAVAAEALGDLRGLAAKAGQIGSYLDAALGTEVPPGVREALQRLNDATRTSPWAGIAAVIREDLPDEAEALLGRLEPTPVASGSIAQVHRAVAPDGRRVAVKVQHPNVARAILGELGEARAIARVVGAVVPGVGGVVDEVRARFTDELDQRAEAAATRAVGALLADAGDVVVPEVVDAWTGRRVLTTTWCEGLDLDAAAAQPDDDLRASWATALLGAFVASTARGLVHADPNAGNFRFRPDGTMALLDFGCVQPLPAEGQEAFRRAFVDGATAPLAALLVGPGRAREAASAVFEGLLAPSRVGGPVTLDELRAVGRAIQAFKVEVARGRSRIDAPWAPLVLRTWLGLLAHVAHLHGALDAERLRARAG